MMAFYSASVSFATLALVAIFEIASFCVSLSRSTQNCLAIDCASETLTVDTLRAGGAAAGALQAARHAAAEVAARTAAIRGRFMARE